MLQVLGGPRAAPAAKVLEEDVGAAIEADERALDKLGCRAPLLVPTRARVPGPTNLGKAATPSAEREETEPDEDAALDPMS